MAKNPILPLYYNDIDRATRTWTDEEFGAYMRLLIEQWDKGGLPNDYQKLTRLATSLDTNWGLLKDKFPLTDGLLKNPVMEEIREKQRKHKEKQKENISKRYQNATKLPTKTLPLESEDENNSGEEVKAEQDEKFYKPTEKEVIEFYDKNGYASHSAKHFFSHYQARGWDDKNGKPVEFWKVTAHGWFKDADPKTEDELTPEQKRIKSAYGFAPTIAK